MKNLLLVALLLLSTLGFSQGKIYYYYYNYTINLIDVNKNPVSSNYTIYNMEGKLVKKGFDNIIDISDISYGVYVLMLEINGKKEIIKVYKGVGTTFNRK